MKRKHMFFLFVIMGMLTAPCAQSQLGLGLIKKHTKVRQTPAKGDYQLEGEDAALRCGYFKERERWIVFSDRANNKTYKSPASDVQTNTIGFMDPCYVIGQKGDYLELVKYDPKLFQNPRKRTIDIKRADYLGWLHKNYLLLWRTALSGQQTGFFTKGVTCFKNEKAFNIAASFAKNDSLTVFSGPSLQEPAGRCNMEALFYIFKQSPDGKQYLIGPRPQFTADNRAAAVSGWISSSLIKAWGERSFFTRQDYPSQNAESKNVSANNTPIYVNNILLTDTFPSVPYSSCCIGTASHSILQRIFPAPAQLSAIDGREMVQTGFLTDILDRSDNEVVNMVGNRLSYNALNCQLRCQHKANIVFVVDGGSDNGKCMNAVQTAVQNLEQYFDTASLFTEYKFGAVVYKDKMNNRCYPATLPLTAGYPGLADFFLSQQARNDCDDNQVEQSVFAGLSRAAGMLTPHKDESNIIVLIGAAGNNTRAREDYAEIVRQLSNSNTRLLVFQAYNGSHPSYNDFFIQGKNIVTKTALNISESKKEKLVDPDDVLKDPRFTLVEGDSGFFYLDYPKTAMTQGFVLFPGKGETMQPAFMIKGLHNLMQQIHDDNQRMEKSLRRYFSINGTRTTRIHETFQSSYPTYGKTYLPVHFLSEALSVEEQSFYVPALVEVDRLRDSSANLKFGILASEEEYEQVIRALTVLGDDLNSSSYSRRATYRHLRRTTKRYLSAHDISLATSVKRLSLASVLEYMTGYRPTNAAWTGTELRMIKKSGQSTRQDVLAFLNACSDKSIWLAENAQNKTISFQNNGQTWYWLTAEQLP